jgi:hypothetical protein
MKIKSFLKLVAVLFPLSLYLIACGSNSTSATSVNNTPTSGPGQFPTSGPDLSPTSGPGQTPTSGPDLSPTPGPYQSPTPGSDVTPTPTFSPDDPGVQAIPQPVSPSDCTVKSDHWECTITLQYSGTNQPTLPWSVTANNLPGVTFTPSSGTFPQDPQTVANIPFNDCFTVQDSFVFAFTTPNGRLKTTTSWQCQLTPTPTTTPTNTPIPTPTDTPTPGQ